MLVSSSRCVLLELWENHCGDNVHSTKILLLVSSTLYGTIYRFVSVLGWLHHVAIAHAVPTREKTRHTRFRESENVENFPLSLVGSKTFVNENLFAARVQLSAGHPRDRTRLFHGEKYFEIQIHKCKEEFSLKKFFIFRTCHSAVKSAESKKIRDECFQVLRPGISAENWSAIKTVQPLNSSSRRDKSFINLAFPMECN